MMTILAVLLAVVGLGGLCYPRRRRATGAWFVAGGLWMVSAWAAGWIDGAPSMLLMVAAPWAALGFGQIWKFRDPEARAAHRAAWIG